MTHKNCVLNLEAKERSTGITNFNTRTTNSFNMASSRLDDSVRVYTTDTIVDNPGAEIVYKGLINCNSSTLLLYKGQNPDFANKMAAAASKRAQIMKGSGTDIQAELTEEAKEKAKKLDANAIVGMKVAGNGESIFGTAVHYTPGQGFTST